MTNGNGGWVAGITFANAYNRGQTLEVLITRTSANGTTTTQTVNVYVGPGGSTTYQAYDNNMSVSHGVRSGVTSVTFTVTKVTTSDANWNTITSPGYGTTQTVTLP